MTSTMPPLDWYLHRLRAMDAAEMLGRAREKLLHKTERFAAAALRDVRLGEVSGDVPALPSKADAPAALRETLAADAAKLLEGKWTLFGWNEVRVSSPPDWHRDCMRGVGVPAEGPKPNHRALPGGADARVIWEINRWAEMARLAMHGWMNDDIAAIRRAQDWLADWVRSNPLGHGVNWTSALEAGLRLINFCWFDALVRRHGAWGTEHGDGELQRKHRELADAIVPAHAWWLRRYLSFGSSANNHRLGELAGLLLAVRRWPGLEKIAGSADELWKQVADCVLTQFAEDGGNREQALHYHLFAIEMALHASRAMHVTGGPVISRLRRAAEFFIRMSHPREPWDYGDSDDAQIVPLTMDRGKAGAEWSAWMSGAHDGGAAALSYWLGVPAIPGPQSPIPSHDWWIAPRSGMAVIERDGWKVRVDASPLGFGKMAAHGHCDALHVSIWDGEHALVIDPGTGGYFASKELRGELASWSAHNGPQPVGGFNAPRRMGTFLWAEHHATPGLSGGEDGLNLTLRHEGLGLSRCVEFPGGGGIGVSDSRSDQGPLRVRWQLAPECEVRLLDPGAAVVGIRRGDLRWRVTFPGAPPRLSLLRSRVSRGFGIIEEAPAIDIASEGGLRSVWRRAAGRDAASGW